jgi:hypothetical protein
MPSCRHTRIEITQEAYMGLEAEAVLKGTTLKKLASQLILKNISQKALQFVTNSMPGLQEDPDVCDTDERINSSSNFRRPRISDNVDVQERIKVLWSMDPRPSQREIAKIINYPASSTKYQIKMMLEKGELEE